MYSVTVRRVRVTVIAQKKAISITYFECVSAALVIQHAKRMRLIIICVLSGSPMFSSHYLTNGTIFGKTLLNIKCVFSFSLQLLSETFLIQE
jgi:hypothetical protein